MKFVSYFVFSLAVLFVSGCGDSQDGTATNESNNAESNSTQSVVETTDSQGDVFVGTLSPSEYPSWSVFMTAEKLGTINGKKGEQGTIEKKYNVDIVLDVNDYDTCLQKYGAGAVDAVCITNTDVLNISLSRPSTAICPTSTSDGADAVISVDAKSLEDLKGVTTYGLSKSVSEYFFVSTLRSKGLDPADYKFSNLDPEAAATALQTGSTDIRSICVWNPFKMQTLRSSKNSSVVMDSSAIPEEIIDMVVVSSETLKKQGGDRFAEAICAVFYDVNNKLADPKTSDATATAIGEDFSNLGLEDMKVCLTETSFYSTPQDGIKLFSSEKLSQTTMPNVVSNCKLIGALNADPTIGYNDPDSQLNFSTRYMESVSK